MTSEELVRDTDPSGDVVLATRFRAGSHAALEEVFRRWSPMVHALTSRAVRDRADADDLTQQVFVKAWQSRERFDPGRGLLRSWLVGITQHVVADHVARTVRDRSLLARAVAAVRLTRMPDRPDTAVGLDVRAALDRLGETRRDVLVLVFVEGLTHREAAVRLGMPLGTVKSHARRGLMELRAMLEVDDDAP